MKANITVANLRANIAQNDMGIHLDVVVSKSLLVIGQTERLFLSNHNLESLTYLDEMHYD